jgi:hypothetical protein
MYNKDDAMREEDKPAVMSIAEGKAINPSFQPDWALEVKVEGHDDWTPLKSLLSFTDWRVIHQPPGNRPSFGEIQSIVISNSFPNIAYDQWSQREHPGVVCVPYFVEATTGKVYVGLLMQMRHVVRNDSGEQAKTWILNVPRGFSKLRDDLEEGAAAEVEEEMKVVVERNKDGRPIIDRIGTTISNTTFVETTIPNYAVRVDWRKMPKTPRDALELFWPLYEDMTELETPGRRGFYPLNSLIEFNLVDGLTKSALFDFLIALRSRVLDQPGRPKDRDVLVSGMLEDWTRNFGIQLQRSSQ